LASHAVSAVGRDLVRQVTARLWQAARHLKSTRGPIRSRAVGCDKSKEDAVGPSEVKLSDQPPTLPLSPPP
jgi:hypothetical protein